MTEEELNTLTERHRLSLHLRLSAFICGSLRGPTETCSGAEAAQAHGLVHFWISRR